MFKNIFNFKETLQSKRAISVAIIGGLLLILGIIGFFNDPIFKLFEVDAPHNILLILLGLYLILFGSKNFAKAKKSATTVGLILALLTIFGFLFVTDTGKLFGLMDWSMEDNFLYLFLSVILLGIGLV
jgi:hypothetical protein